VSRRVDPRIRDRNKAAVARHAADTVVFQTALHAAAAAMEPVMDALLTLNLFSLSLPAALLGAAVFGGLIALPLLRPGPPAQ
jgi:hypothetical protein